MDTAHRIVHIGVRMDCVRYFAYGSNMQRATFAGRRGISPTAAHAARVTGWRLVVDKPALFPVGHSFANLVPDPDGEVFGVLYDITLDELARVELTEGVTLGNYQRIEVEAALLATAAAAPACTLVSDKRDPALCPSAHYMTLVIEGAREHGLPDEWIGYLQGFPTAPDNAEAIAARALMDELLARTRR